LVTNLELHQSRKVAVAGSWLLPCPSGKTADDAMAKAEVLALRAMADRLEQNESRPVEINISLPLAA
jgi:hypothetical protein